MITYSDTEEMLKIASELKTHAKDLDIVFGNLNARLTNVLTVSREWTGSQAKYFFDKVTADTKNYSQQSENIRKIANELEAQATNLDTIAGGINRNE